MKLISVITPCFNEVENVEALAAAVRAEFERIGRYDFEHIFIDNSSTDGTSERLREMAQVDSRIKVIVNVCNYGHARSPHHAMKQTSGEAVIGMCADFQDPPEMISRFLELWEQGYKVVAGVKESTEERGVVRLARKLYYRLLSRSSDVPLLNDFTGFGLYDKSVIEVFKTCNDESIYFRGFIAELGYPIAKLPYRQPLRRAGRSKNNFWTLLDAAISGFTAHGRDNMRLITIMGFVMAGVSMLVSLAYLFMKLMFWQSFELGLAPLLIGIFFFVSVQLFVLGVIGEYVGALIERVRFRPPLIERERINLPPRETGP